MNRVGFSVKCSPSPNNYYTLTLYKDGFPVSGEPHRIAVGMAGARREAVVMKAAAEQREAVKPQEFWV